MFSLVLKNGYDSGLNCVNAVDARQLWGALEVASEFSKWIQRRIEEAQLVENIDFVKFDEPNNNNMLHYVISLDAAKSIAMLERTDKGRQIRQYFIDVEKKATQQKSTIKDPAIAAMILQLEQLDLVKQKQAEHSMMLAAQQQGLEKIQEDAGDNRLSASQVAQIDRAIHEKYLASNYDGRVAGMIKKRIKETFLMPPLSAKTYKDCAQKDFSEILKLIRNF